MSSDSVTGGRLYDYGSTQVGQRISILPGVSRVVVYGTKSAIRIKADPSAGAAGDAAARAKAEKLAEREAHRRAHANRRRAANHHGLDGACDFRRGLAADVDLLRRQLALIDGAQISTIHSFCTRVLRQNLFALPVSSKARCGCSATTVA